jgi:hypothetical protein
MWMAMASPAEPGQIGPSPAKSGNEILAMRISAYFTSLLPVTASRFL